jgi:glycosyltransferase involved in cell wall biosynthesis
MNILHLTWSRMQAYGGIQSAIRNLTLAAVHHGHAARHHMLPSDYPQHQMRSVDSDSSTINSLAGDLDILIDRWDIDVLHGHNLHISYKPGVQRLLRDAADKHRIPLVNTVHDLDNARFDCTTAAEALAELTQACHVVTSAYNARRFEQLFGFTATAIIPPGIDFNAFDPFHPAPANSVAIPGRLARGKGILRGIEVAGRAARVVGNLYAVLSERGKNCVGEDRAFMQEIDEAFDRYPLLARAHVDGPNAIPAIYERASLTLAFPIAIEGFGMTPLESLAAGRPIIAVPTGGMTWLRGIQGAHVSAEYSVEAESVALVQMLENWPEWRQRALAGRSDLEVAYDCRASMNNYLPLYADKSLAVAHSA